jgi:hypothetical protein
MICFSPMRCIRRLRPEVWYAARTFSLSPSVSRRHGCCSLIPQLGHADGAAVPRAVAPQTG